MCQNTIQAVPQAVIGLAPITVFPKTGVTVPLFGWRCPPGRWRFPLSDKQGRRRWRRFHVCERCTDRAERLPLVDHSCGRLRLGERYGVWLSLVKMLASSFRASTLQGGQSPASHPAQPRLQPCACEAGPAEGSAAVTACCGFHPRWDEDWTVELRAPHSACPLRPGQEAFPEHPAS